MALIADGNVYWRGAFGVKDFDSKAPVGEDTVFEAASVSKTVFAYVVMKLVEKGVLDSRHATDKVHTRSHHPGRRPPGSDHGAACPVAYDGFSELAIGEIQGICCGIGAKAIGLHHHD